jgi:hypothetical protein
MGPASALASGFSYIFGALFIGLAAWLIAWLIQGLRLGRIGGKARGRTAYDEAEADEGIVLEPNAWMQQAGVYAGSEDYRRAFRAVFVAILLLLDQGGLIEFDRSRTNGDYLRLLRRQNLRRLYDVLDPLVLEFDRRWYGTAETGIDDFHRIQETFNRVRELKSETAAPTVPAPAPGKA